MPAGVDRRRRRDGNELAGIFGDILCARMAQARRRRARHRRRRARPRGRARTSSAGLVPGRGCTRIGQRAHLRRLAGADRLRRSRRDAERRDRRRSRRRGRRSRRALDDVVAAALEQERLEGWIMREVEAGVASARPLSAGRSDAARATRRGGGEERRRKRSEVLRAPLWRGPAVALTGPPARPARWVRGIQYQRTPPAAKASSAGAPDPGRRATPAPSRPRAAPGPAVEPMSDISRQRPRKWARPTIGE